MKPLRTLSLGALAVVAACQSSDPGAGGVAPGEDPPIGPAGTEAVVPVGVLDPASVLTRVGAFAFQPNGAQFSSGARGYTVDADLDGFALTPLRFAHGRSRRHAALHDKVTSGAPARFETSAITRGDADLANGGHGATLAEDGSLVLGRGDAVEKLTNTKAGVEQSWRFGAKPRGDGDVVVRVAEHGPSFARASATGLDFEDRATETGVHYGVGTWIDALGHRTEIRPEWDGSAIVLRVPSSLVESSAYPAVLDPLTNPVTDGAVPEAYIPRSAFGGGFFLVAWEDYATGSSRVRAARIDASTGAIVGQGFYVSPLNVVQAEPHVAFDGTNFIVAWEDKRRGFFDSFAARIKPSDGSIVTPAFAVSPQAGGDHTAPAIACTATNCLVAWEDGPSPAQIHTRTVATADNSLGADTTLTAAAEDQIGVASATDGTNYYVAWEGLVSTLSHVRGARVSGAGAILTPATDVALHAGEQFSPALSFSSGNFVVAYADSRSGTDADVYVTHVSASTGAVVEANGIAVVTGANDQDSPAIAFDGTNHLLGWWDNNDLFAQRLTPAGAAVGSAFALANAAGDQELPMLAFGGGGYFATWADQRVQTPSPIWAAFGARVSTAGSNLDPSGIPISDGGPRCVSTTLTASPASPQNAGTSVNLTATATCVDGAVPVFQFILKTPTGAVVKQDYSTSSTFTLDTTGLNDDITLEVDVAHQGGATSPPDAAATLPYHINGAGACSAVTLSVAEPSPQNVGAPIHLNAVATCSGGKTPVYAFNLQNPAGIWSSLRGYSATSSIVWDTTGLTNGSYRLEVLARASTSTAAFESNDSSHFMTLQGGAATCTSVSGTVSPASPAPAGTTVAITAIATCTSGTAEYKFTALIPGRGGVLLRDWAAGNSFNWDTTGLAGLSDTIQIVTRHAGSTAVNGEGQVQIPYTLTGGTPACTSTTVTATSTGASTVSIASSATCTQGAAPQFRVVLYPPVGNYVVLQNFAATTPTVWNTTGFPKGSYLIEVDSRYTGGTTIDSHGFATFTL